MGGDFIDNSIFAALADQRFDLLAFLGAHIVFCKDIADFINADSNRRFIVRRAVNAQQVFQHKGGHVCAALEHGGQILAHDFSRKAAYNFLVQGVHGRSSSIIKSPFGFFYSCRRQDRLAAEPVTAFFLFRR